jgi:hypothetical protein
LGKVNIEGMVYEILYAAQKDRGQKGKGLMGRLFR